MGQLLSSLWFKLTQTDRPKKIVLVGLNNAGKTSILYKLALEDISKDLVNQTQSQNQQGQPGPQSGQGPVVSIKSGPTSTSSSSKPPILTQPTIGCNVETIHFGSLTLTAWDLGGQERLRDLWPSYFKAGGVQTDAILFVVDASEDAENLLIAKLELMNLLILEPVRQSVKAVLILANKQDLSGAKSAAELAECLGLSEIKTHDWHISPCCALTGEGLATGLEWVASKLKVEN